MQLPGIEPIIPPVKELTAKIPSASYSRSDNNAELDISNLTPWMNLQLKSPR
jgi:hypothetical protein